ncbi:hypothetical protein [Salinigranum salinum]|uniref:hypothetical protein n=1 Tax=Salinigranum salinum TaxID=1364937 RepID=UPI001F04CFDA|nr:hypothetical protein [Salinigranum salinum]
MNVPRGRLVHSRIVDDPGTVLRSALDRSLTGYAVVEPQDALLFDDGARGVVTFEDGVPVLVYDATTDRGGPDALADLAGPGPYSVELYELPAEDLAAAHDTPALRVPPDMPAERLAGDATLADRTREAAPDSRLADDEPTGSAVEAFLADEAKIEAIRAQARDEAQRRAEEWGLTGALVDDSAGASAQADADDGDSPTDADGGDCTAHPPDGTAATSDVD